MPRYQRAADILRLALEMQASAEGLTLDDIRERFRVDGRTATRMRDAVAARSCARRSARYSSATPALDPC